MKNRRYNLSSMQKQQGVVLIVALIMLLLITVLGVSAVNITRDKTQIAGNSMYTMLVHQGAESTLAKITSSDYYAKLASEELLKKYDVPNVDIFDSGEVINGSTELISTASVVEVTVLGADRCPITNAGASSSDFSCSYFEFTTRTQLRATGARATHSEGRVMMKVKENN